MEEAALAFGSDLAAGPPFCTKPRTAPAHRKGVVPIYSDV
jgi:hypothetical protein